ncbi:MAG: hypothetical protein CSA24_02790 [Deltaproteobacteria bacterium]|nr:MAG: hypothetical protein CSA24_02790 [Deltaproteobacteria bacterium]
MMRKGLLLFALLLTACGGDSTSSALQALAENYGSESASATKARLDTLSVREHWVLELVQMGPAFKLAVFLRACEEDNSLMWRSLVSGTPYNCAFAAAEWQQTVDLIASTGFGSIEENVESGRTNVIIYEKCESGEIDKATCDVYYGIQSQVAAGVAQTNEVIIDNIGNTCTVGQDPGCYP